jgi:hypothetical protein
MCFPKRFESAALDLLFDLRTNFVIGIVLGHRAPIRHLGAQREFSGNSRDLSLRSEMTGLPS